MRLDLMGRRMAMFDGVIDDMSLDLNEFEDMIAEE